MAIPTLATKMIKRLMMASLLRPPQLQHDRRIYAAQLSAVNRRSNWRAPDKARIRADTQVPPGYETAIVEGGQRNNIVYTLGLAAGFLRLAHERHLD